MAKQRQLAITEGDAEVFWWLWMLRVMTLEQIRRVRYYQEETGRLSSLDNVRKRLKRLWDAGYLQGDTLLQTNERVYFLGKKALAVLREYYGVDQQKLYTPRGSETMQQLLHPLLVSECAVLAVEAIRGSQMRLVELESLRCPFLHTHAVGNASAKKHVERFVTQEDIRGVGGQRWRIRPDLVFALAQGDAARLFFLEADRGTERPREIAEKQAGYASYAQYPDPDDPSRLLWQRYSNAVDCRVLLLTTDERRVQKLRGHLETLPGYELMAFSSIAEVKGRNFVFDEVWSTAQGDGRALAIQAE